MPDVDILIPFYNESPSLLEETVGKIHAAFQAEDGAPSYRILIVDDGSTPALSDGCASGDPRVTLIRHQYNRGYGAALKTGLRAGQAPWIAILDADGTYPADRLPELLRFMPDADMVVGVRTGTTNQTPWLRRGPKALLNRVAGYLANTRIVDLNSGMRVFRRELAEYLWALFPQRFSFTSTLTMGAVMGGFQVRDVSIDYFKRSGKSSISPIRDTWRFFCLVFRIGMLFAPLRIFSPLASALLFVGLAKGARDYIAQGHIGNLSPTLVLTGLQIFMMGVLANLIVQVRKLGRT